MARPNKGRGRKAPQLPPPKVTPAELRWVLDEVTRLQCIGHRTNLTKFMRDRILAGMPGYKG